MVTKINYKNLRVLAQRSSSFNILLSGFEAITNLAIDIVQKFILSFNFAQVDFTTFYSAMDVFYTPRAAGSVDGTDAELGPSTRTVVDTDNALWIAAIGIIFEDYFTTAISAGSVDGTAADDGPSTRTVVDTGNKLSIGAIS